MRKEEKEVLLLNMYRMAYVDGETDPRELDLLHRFATKEGITEQNLAEYLLSPTNANVVPQDMEGKIYALYYLATMAHADGKIEETERKFLENTAISYGFLENNAQDIVDLFLNKVEEGLTFEELYDYIQNN